MVQLNHANQELIDKAHQIRNSKALMMNLDSTHADTHGKQESASYNSHYRTIGFHPLIAFDGITGDFLKAQRRPGHIYISNGVVEFIKPLIEYYNRRFPESYPIFTRR